MTKKFIILLIISLILPSCEAMKPKKVDTRTTPISGPERSKKNVREGGSSVAGLFKRGGGSFEFSSSNPMWRASLETQDFLPMTTVDYSGGIIITDWYSENSSNEALKISIRFLSNEVRTDSLKIIVHKRKCSQQNCNTNLLENSKVGKELTTSIIRKAALLEREDKKKKKN